MSKTGKKKHEIKEEVDTSTLSKKELYDLNKKKKDKEKVKTNDSKKKKKKKKNTSNLGVRIFAIIMLLLMIASILASSFAYFG